jgi:hypothetical protein
VLPSLSSVFSLVCCLVNIVELLIVAECIRLIGRQLLSHPKVHVQTEEATLCAGHGQCKSKRHVLALDASMRYMHTQTSLDSSKPCADCADDAVEWIVLPSLLLELQAGPE